jgi:Flp pilus assembly protein TadG
MSAATRLGAARAAAARWRADERGAALIEFAVVVPVLLTLVMAIIDFGRMFAVAASLAAAVRDGARAGATITDFADATQVAAVRTRVVAAFQPFGGAALATSGVTVVLDASRNVNVSVSSYTYRPITPIASMIGLGTITLRRTAVFRWERTS